MSINFMNMFNFVYNCKVTPTFFMMNQETVQIYTVIVVTCTIAVAI